LASFIIPRLSLYSILQHPRRSNSTTIHLPVALNALCNFLVHSPGFFPEVRQGNFPFPQGPFRRGQGQGRFLCQQRGQARNPLTRFLNKLMTSFRVRSLHRGLDGLHHFHLFQPPTKSIFLDPFHHDVFQTQGTEIFVLFGITTVLSERRGWRRRMGDRLVHFAQCASFVSRQQTGGRRRSVGGFRSGQGGGGSGTIPISSILFFQQVIILIYQSAQGIVHAFQRGQPKEARGPRGRRRIMTIVAPFFVVV